MIRDGRILCVNPTCRRTAAVEKHPGCDSICCGKCWRKLPQHLRDRHAALKRRDKRIERLVMKRAAEGLLPSRQQIDALSSSLDHLQRRNWGRISAYFVKPERPIGLEGFLQEIGL